MVRAANSGRYMAAPRGDTVGQRPATVRGRAGGASPGSLARRVRPELERAGGALEQVLKSDDADARGVPDADGRGGVGDLADALDLDRLVRPGRDLDLLPDHDAELAGDLL